MKLITDPNEFNRCISLFKTNLEKMIPGNDREFLYHAPGGEQFNFVGRYSNDPQFWYATREDDKAYFFGFGFENPINNRIHRLRVQVIFQRDFSVRYSRNALFAKDERGGIFIVCRGRINGGKGKRKYEYFSQNTTLTPVNEIQLDHFFLLGKLNSPVFDETIKSYVREIYRLKDMPLQNKK